VAAGNGRQRLALIFACIVTGAWTVSFIVAIVTPTYNPPAGLTPLVFVIAGWLYREAIGSRHRPSKEEEVDDSVQ
jgi:hypothetical protein